jgi:hypothetical protein
MKKIFILSLAFLALACNNNDPESGEPENDLDAASMFIRAALDGRYDDARRMMIPDSINENRMDVTERTYSHFSRLYKRSYKDANINIHDTKKINDSTTVVIYSNSFRNKTDSVKVVRRNGKWLVDFKYTFEGTLNHGE